MAQLVTWGQSLGVPGLFLLALLDSGGIPTGGGPDVLLVLLVGGHRGYGFVLLLAAAAVAGSSIGCLLLYRVARRSGVSVLARFDPDRVERIRQRLDRFGPLAVVLAVVAPPPYPMKAFVLSAGALRMPTRPFLVSVIIGRSVRYLGLALLAKRYSKTALTHVRDHLPLWAVVFSALVAGLLAVCWYVRRRRHVEPASTGTPDVPVSG